MAIEKTKSKTNHDFSQIVVLPKYYFYCQSKRIIKNPIELIKVLKLMHDDEFNYHVTDTKNDFADWIVNVFGADDLATNINDLKTKKEMLECIEKYFEESIMMDQHKDKISNTGEFEKISETVVISNEKGIIQYVNPSFTKYSGYSKNEVIGKNPKLLKSGRHGDEFYEILWKNILSGKTFHTNFINKAKDGHLYKQEASISPVKNKDGKIVQFISKGKYIGDLSSNEQKKNESEIQKQKVIEPKKIGALKTSVSLPENKKQEKENVVKHQKEKIQILKPIKIDMATNAENLEQKFRDEFDKLYEKTSELRKFGKDTKIIELRLMSIGPKIKIFNVAPSKNDADKVNKLILEVHSEINELISE